MHDISLVANTIRGLAMDGVEKAKSGHPGLPMGAADIAAVLWLEFLKQCPERPDWADRDRFVLSAGHGSMLLYSLLHLAGYDLPIDQLARFRQWDSRTPGHPEYGETTGVETTTGPLGQGCGNAVGMALAERMLAERFNTAEAKIVDHFTYVICSDGDLMEGISHESFALAGHLGLNKLIVFYDDNRITIEGSTSLAYSDDVRRRFEGYHWNVLEIDGHSHDQIREAIQSAHAELRRPTIVICHTQIGFGSPGKQGSAAAHGEPLGDAEVLAAKRHLGLPEDKPFWVPPAVRDAFADRAAQQGKCAATWDSLLESWTRQAPERRKEWDQAMSLAVPDNIDELLPDFPLDKPIATRSSAGKAQNALAAALPFLVGGSADLSPSTKTNLTGAGSVSRESFCGRNLHFGVRELGMGAILNGMALHGGFRVFGSTFLTFLDYCRPAVRLSCIMKVPVIYVFTHDSIFVGEDGPTHQPVEHFASLRCFPGITVIRPADATESAAAWVAALRNTHGPTVLLLSRQNLPVLDRSQFPAAAMLERGAYTLWQAKPDTEPDLLLLATGSEVSIALEAARELAATRNPRVVSMPSWELFESQDATYRDQVLPPSCTARIAVEAASSFGWQRYVGAAGRTVCIDRFGASAPYKTLAEQFGFTAANVVRVARELLDA